MLAHLYGAFLSSIAAAASLLRGEPRGSPAEECESRVRNAGTDACANHDREVAKGQVTLRVARDTASSRS